MNDSSWKLRDESPIRPTRRGGLRRIAAALALAGMTITTACGGSPKPTAASAPAPRASAAAAPPEEPPTVALRRSEVQRVVREGLGAFLQHVEVEEALEGGKFKGFRVRALHGDGWRGVDLQPGDVVTRVNGFSIERPDTALEAFRSLDVASELRVDYERQGAPRALRYSIVDEPLGPR